MQPHLPPPALIRAPLCLLCMLSLGQRTHPLSIQSVNEPRDSQKTQEAPCSTASQPGYLSLPRLCSSRSAQITVSKGFTASFPKALGKFLLLYPALGFLLHQ